MWSKKDRLQNERRMTNFKLVGRMSKCCRWAAKDLELPDGRPLSQPGADTPPEGAGRSTGSKLNCRTNIWQRFLNEKIIMPMVLLLEGKLEVNQKFWFLQCIYLHRERLIGTWTSFFEVVINAGARVSDQPPYIKTIYNAL